MQARSLIQIYALHALKLDIFHFYNGYCIYFSFPIDVFMFAINYFHDLIQYIQCTMLMGIIVYRATAFTIGGFFHYIFNQFPL